MTQDEIIEMAREAGCIPRRSPEFWEDIQVFATPDVIVKFANLVAAKEREACAQVCDNRITAYQYATDLWAQEHINEARHLAAAIRARGEQA